MNRAEYIKRYDELPPLPPRPICPECGSDDVAEHKREPAACLPEHNECRACGCPFRETA